MPINRLNNTLNVAATGGRLVPLPTGNGSWNSSEVGKTDKRCSIRPTAKPDIAERRPVKAPLRGISGACLQSVSTGVFRHSYATAKVHKTSTPGRMIVMIMKSGTAGLLAMMPESAPSNSRRCNKRIRTQFDRTPI